MIAKKNLITILYLIIWTSGIAQDYKKDIESELFDYFKSIESMDFEKACEYMPPELFEIIPKSQLIKTMEQTFNNPSFEFEFKDLKILDINDSHKVENKYYALLSYSHQMNFKIKGVENEMIINSAKLSFAQSFGAGNVKYNKEEGFFEILSRKDAYGISNNGESDWKFLLIENKQDVILDKILPKELTEKYKNYR